MAFTGPGDDTSINRVAITTGDKYLSLYKYGKCQACRGNASVSSLYYSITRWPPCSDTSPRPTSVILRDPGGLVCFSVYLYQGCGVWSRATTSGRALDREVDRICCGWHHIWHYIGMGRYAVQQHLSWRPLVPTAVKVL